MAKQLNERLDIPRERQYVYLTPEHKQMIKVLAMENRMSVSKYISELITDHIIDSFGNVKSDHKVKGV